MERAPNIYFNNIYDENIAREYLPVKSIGSMVLVLYGNPDIGGHVRSNYCCLICLRHLL